MTKIALLLPPHQLKRGRLIPSHHPIVTATLAGVAQKAGAEVLVLDVGVNGWSPHEVLRKIEEFQPDWVGMISFEYRREIPVETTLQFVDFCKSRLSMPFGFLNCPLDNEELPKALESGRIEFFVRGDSEFFVHQCVAHNNWDEGGIVQMRGGELLQSKPIRQVDWSLVPIPAWELFDLSRYVPSAHRYKKAPVFPVLASRSCPFGCDFCPHMLFHSSETHSVRPVEDILKEVAWLQEHFQAADIEFYDPTFGIKKEHTLAICEGFLQLPKKIGWSCFTRTDLWEREMLEKVAAAGCHSMLFGVESADQKIIDRTGKGIEIQQVVKFIAECKAVGIDTVASFILGLPMETPQSIRQSIRFVCQVNPTYAQFHQARAFFDDPEWKKWGTLAGSWTETSSSINGIAYLPNGFTQSQMERYLLRAYLRFYGRPHKILELGSKIRHRSDIKRFALGLKQLGTHFWTL